MHTYEWLTCLSAAGFLGCPGPWRVVEKSGCILRGVRVCLAVPLKIVWPLQATSERPTTFMQTTCMFCFACFSPTDCSPLPAGAVMSKAVQNKWTRVSFTFACQYCSFFCQVRTSSPAAFTALPPYLLICWTHLIQV